MRTFDDYKNEVSSEKISLAVLEASKRLIAFTNHSGSIYKLNGFNYPVIASIQDTGVALTSVADLASVVAGTYFNDVENSVLYIQTSDSVNPNSKFMHVTFKLFFASAPATLPHDLADGFEVYWEPMLASTSDFGVEIDTVDQQNETIEGSGTLKLHNDQSFWPANFDKLFFENQNCWIYSWSRGLDADESKLLFKGNVESKSYSSSHVSFKLKDQMSKLRNPLVLPDIQQLGLRNPPNLNTAKQRLIYGRVFGHRLTNLDAVINNRYPLPGTISTTFGSTGVTGTGTSFLTHLNPDDRLDIGGVEYTIAEVISDTQLNLTEAFDVLGINNLSVDVIPDKPKRWFNRVWSVAGHALREPVTTIDVGSSTTQLFVGSTKDMFDGDFIYVGELGSGELVTIGSVLNETQLTLSTSLAANPSVGTQVLRPCVQNVMIDDTSLVFYRDYTVDASTGVLTLRDTAEVNAGPTRESLALGYFTEGSRDVYSAQRATATLATTAPILLGSSFIDSSRNGNTFALDILSAAANPSDTVLAAFSGTEAATVLTITPNNGTNYTKAPTATLNLNTDIILTNVVTGTSRNGYTFQVNVNPAAANPLDTVIVNVTGSSSVVVVTITPNNGTNNFGIPVSLTTAEFVDVINDNTTPTKSVTVVDSSELLGQQNATGGDATLMVDGGEGDGVTATFAGGINLATTPISLTTAEVVELINTGEVVGKKVTVTDVNSLRNRQTATGGNATLVANGGQGDNLTATFSGGSSVGRASYKTTFKAGDMIRPSGTSQWYEVLTVDSDTRLILRQTYADTSTSQVNIQYKSLLFDDSKNVLHCEVLGRTANGDTSSTMLRKAPEIVNQLLQDAGFSSDQINIESFVDSQKLVPEDISFVVPPKYNETTKVTYRDVVNSVNRSVFGIMFQDNEFKLSYDVLRPALPAIPILIHEADVISWSVTSTNKNMIKTAIVEYGFREYDPGTKQSSVSLVNKTSDAASYILGTSRERTFKSLLTNSTDAQRLCDRWKFLLEFSTNAVRIETKLQLIDAEINDVIDFEHKKFYERFAGASNRKFLAIEKITKNGVGVTVECVDLSNAFNRVALISDTTTKWSDSSEEVRMKTGFISDENGLIDNNEASFGTNLIW